MPIAALSVRLVANPKPPQASRKDDYFSYLLAEPTDERGMGDVVRYDHSTGQWHIWDGARWAPDRTTLIFELVRQRALQWIADATETGHGGDTVALLSVILDASKKASVLKMLASDPRIAMSGDEWDPQPELMGFPNGVLDLRTLKFYAKDDPIKANRPDPAWLISRAAKVDWDPDADKGPFMDFLDDIMSHDPDMVGYVLTVLGYSMLATNQEQKFWMWIGGGSNGKGILARTVSAALGDYAYSPPDTLYMKNRFGAVNASVPRPELMKLQGTRFTFMSEPQGGQFNEELLKAHTGGDPIEARTLYSKTFKTFTPTHKIVFLANDPPRTEDVGPSMQRRVRLVRFMEDYRDPSRADNTLEARLQSPAALRGALVAMATAANMYLQWNALPEPQKVTDWSRAYIADNDPITSFLGAMCVQSIGGDVQAGPFFKSFDDWCGSNGFEKTTQNAFAREMTKRFERKSRPNGNFYVGVRLKNITDIAEDGNDD